MELSEVSLKIIFLFLPGIIATIIINNLTEHDEVGNFQFLIKSFICGIISYFFLFLFVETIKFIINLFFIFKPISWSVNFLDCIFDSGKKINIYEIGFACISGVIISLLASYSINHKILHRFAKYFNISRKFGDLDVWGYVFNSDDIEWVLIRDYDKDIMYEGWVGAFSASKKDSELFIKDVIVYRMSNGQKLYDIDGMYTNFNKEDQNIVLEFREITERGN